MTCTRKATCRARFARGEQACVRCAEGKLDIGDVEDLDDPDEDEEAVHEASIFRSYEDTEDEEDGDIGEGETDDDDDDEAGYTTQPDGVFSEIAHALIINGCLVPGIRVTLTFEDGESKEYVFVVENGPGGIPGDIRADINPKVDRYVKSGESLYDVLKETTGFVVKQK